MTGSRFDRGTPGAVPTVYVPLPGSPGIGVYTARARSACRLPPCASGERGHGRGGGRAVGKAATRPRAHTSGLGRGGRPAEIYGRLAWGRTPGPGQRRAGF